MANRYICTDVYTVQAGDTLYSIAQEYQVEVNLLMRANRIRNPYNLRIGARLCIPGLAENRPTPMPPLPQVPPDEPQDGAETPDTPNTPDIPAPPAHCQAVHIVKAGDTLYMIAKQHNVTLEALMEANKSIDPYNMQIGQEICIPG